MDTFAVNLAVYAAIVCLLAAPGCDPTDGDMDGDIDGDGDGDVDADIDADSDIDSDIDGDRDGDGDSDSDTDSVPCRGECDRGEHTSCSCAASDPCGWASDGFCDYRCEGEGHATFDDGSDCDAFSNEYPCLVPWLDADCSTCLDIVGFNQCESVDIDPDIHGFALCTLSCLVRNGDGDIHRFPGSNCDGHEFDECMTYCAEIYVEFYEAICVSDEDACTSHREETCALINEYMLETLAGFEGRCPFCTDCTPQCAGRECGPDGCDGECGSCASVGACNARGQCTTCEPDCGGRNCGPDGCGGGCGTCEDDELCLDDGRCCRPNCSGRVCGTDRCGGSCGTCGAGQVCTDRGECCTVTSCDGRDCGSNGCGGSCGTCGDHQSCADGHCISTDELCSREGLSCGSVNSARDRCMNCPAPYTCTDDRGTYYCAHRCGAPMDCCAGGHEGQVMSGTYCCLPEGVCGARAGYTCPHYSHNPCP